MTVWTFTSIKELRKCVHCGKRKTKIFAFGEDTGEFSTFCVKCFRELFPNYSLENTCAYCEAVLNCEVQEILFKKSEIKKFKETFDPTTQRIKLLKEID